MRLRTNRPWLSAFLSSALLPTLFAPATAAANSVASSKRGLVFTPNPKWPDDNFIWARQPSDLTWYYNYGASPSPAYSNLTQDEFEFVPMLWGAPADVSDTSFLSTVKGLVKDRNINITHVMSFNEPDGPNKYGGSEIEPSVAAQVWVKNIIPLQEMGIRVGLPACTGGWGGLPWTKQFLGNCSKLISSGGKTKNCTYDFVPLHWYGNFEGLASHIGEYSGAFPNTSIWVTEYNLNDQDLPSTQSFYNTSAEYMDRLDSVGRYSLFGAFRSSVSNVGPNAAMLSAGGRLTDIGAWYLGRPATGVDPSSKSPAARASPPGAGVAVAAVAAVAVAALVGF